MKDRGIPDGDDYEERKLMDNERLRAEIKRLRTENAAQASALELAKVALEEVERLDIIGAHVAAEAIAAIEALPAAPKGGAK